VSLGTWSGEPEQEYEGRDHVGPACGRLQGDPAAVGGSDQRRALDAEGPHQVGDVLGVVVRAVRHRRLAESLEVAADDPVSGVEQDLPLRIPHASITYRGMEEQERRSIAGYVMR
jgi:hypothetical protein